MIVMDFSEILTSIIDPGPVGVPPPPLRGNFGDSDFLKAHNVFNQIQVVCTLAVGASWRNKHLK